MRRCLSLIERTSFQALPDSHYVAPLPNYYQFAGPGANLEEDNAADSWPRTSAFMFVAWSDSLHLSRVHLHVPVCHL
jgi:hypothetical protein